MHQSRSQEPNFYQLLGVEYNDPQAKIRARYRQLARQTHPDSAGDHETADEFTRYTQAYRVLSDPARREQYNQEIGIFIHPRSLIAGYDVYQTIVITPEQARKGHRTPLTYRIDDPCGRCWGQGCENCQNIGVQILSACIEINVTPGTKHGQTIFIEGKGAKSEPNGTPGNLLVYVVIK